MTILPPPTGDVLDDDTADRLVRGLVAPDDAPPGYAAVAGLLQELRAEPVVVDERRAWALASVVRANATPGRSGGRKRIRRVLAGGVIVALSAVSTAAARVAVVDHHPRPEPPVPATATADVVVPSEAAPVPRATGTRRPTTPPPSVPPAMAADGPPPLDLPTVEPQFPDTEATPTTEPPAGTDTTSTTTPGDRHKSSHDLTNRRNARPVPGD